MKAWRRIPNIVSKMYKIDLLGASEHVISNVPCCQWVLQQHTPSFRWTSHGFLHPSRVRVELGVPHGSPLLVQSALEAFSTYTAMFLVALFSIWECQCTQGLLCAKTPLQPTLMGVDFAFQLCFCQLMTSFFVPVFFLWTSSRWSSLGNVSFIGRSFLIPFETRGMSGLGVDLGWSVLCSDSENTKAEILKLCCLLLICRRARKSDVSRSERSQTSGYFV